MGSAGRGKWLLGLALAGAPGLAWAAAAGPARVARPSGPPPEAIALVRDMSLGVRVRKALAADPELGKLNLVVKARAGVVTLWGPVPSKEDGARALELARQEPGVAEVRSELYVKPAEGGIDLLLPAGEGPTRSLSASPDPVTGALGPREGRPSRLPGAVPVGREGPVAPTARLLPPEATADAPKATPGTLGKAVEQVRRGEARFRGVPVEVRGATVVVGGPGARGEDVMALAHALRGVPGVERVVLAD